jgi:hypothetical protein
MSTNKLVASTCHPNYMAGIRKKFIVLAGPGKKHKTA